MVADRGRSCRVAATYRGAQLTSQFLRTHTQKGGRKSVCKGRRETQKEHVSGCVRIVQCGDECKIRGLGAKYLHRGISVII